MTLGATPTKSAPSFTPMTDEAFLFLLALVSQSSTLSSELSNDGNGVRDEDDVDNVDDDADDDDDDADDNNDDDGSWRTLNPLELAGPLLILLISTVSTGYLL